SVRQAAQTLIVVSLMIITIVYLYNHMEKSLVDSLFQVLFTYLSFSSMMNLLQIFAGFFR
ncbi:MAG: hypothetical protein KAG66_21865, partial [Methylococcales bacterium]|nr:hypothetical protein [Methylococcales bacterium]